MYLKFLVVRISGKSFLNERLEYGRLGCAVIAKFSEQSLQILLMYAYERRRGYSAEKQVLGVCLVEAIEVSVWGR